MADNLAELCSLGWKVELLSEEPVYLAEKISRLCVVKCSLVSSYHFILKMRGIR